MTAWGFSAIFGAIISRIQVKVSHFEFHMTYYSFGFFKIFSHFGFFKNKFIINNYSKIEENFFI